MFVTSCGKGGGLSRRQRFVKKRINNLVTSTSAPPFRSDDGCIVQIPACDPFTPYSGSTTYVSRSSKIPKVTIESARTWLRIQLYRARCRLRGCSLFARRWLSRIYIPMRQIRALFPRTSIWSVPELPSLLGDWYITTESARCEDGRPIR